MPRIFTRSAQLPDGVHRFHADKRVLVDELRFRRPVERSDDAPHGGVLRPIAYPSRVSIDPLAQVEGLAASKQTRPTVVAEILQVEFPLVELQLRASFGFLPGPDGEFSTDTTDIRCCFAYTKNNVLMATNPEITSEIEKRADKSFDWYAYAVARFGAVRMEETNTVLVPCDESP